MMPPVRCFTCGKPTSALQEKYDEAVAKGKDKSKVLDELQVSRYCCRRMLLSYVNAIDEIEAYPRF
ncbi:DNA-directed RNA polymerase subunit N [uncultured archaeon]|nr:DNA-directed RNA polymerase subunit N [uncultured archaeon]